MTNGENESNEHGRDEQRQPLSGLENDCRDDRAQIAALEREVKSLQQKHVNTQRHVQVLELELESMRSSTAWRIARSSRDLAHRFRTGLRLMRRFSHALIRFGPVETLRRAKSYLGSRRSFRKPALAAVLPASCHREASTDSFVQLPQIQYRARWAMYVSEFLDGGLEKVVLDLAVELSSRGIHCSIIVKGTAGRAGEEARRSGVEVATFGGDGVALLRFIGDQRIERVIAHHCYDFLEQIAAAGVTVDEVIHNAYHWQKGDRSLAELRDQCIDQCVAVSEFVNSYSRAELKINPDKLRVIHNGLARQGLIRPPLQLMKQRRMHTLSAPVLVMLANAHPQKNHIAVLRAIHEIKQSVPNVKIYLCGVIDERTALGKSIRATADKLELSANVEFTGPLDRQAISRLLHAAHIALLPSLVEGYSIASLEYCYFGLPMVLSDTGAAQSLRQSYGSVELAADVAIPAGQLTVTAIERQSQRPTDNSVASIVSAVNRVLAHYSDYLDRAEMAANNWKQYSMESTVDSYLLLENQ